MSTSHGSGSEEDLSPSSRPQKAVWLYKLNKEDLTDLARECGLVLSGKETLRQIRLTIRTHLQTQSGKGERKEVKPGTSAVPTLAPVTSYLSSRPVEVIRRWGLTFNNSPTLCAEDFLIRVTEKCLSYQLEEADVLAALPELLDGTPLLWYRLNRLNWRTWGEFQRDFKIMFFPPEYQKRLREEIRLRTQGDSEDLATFAVNLCTLMSRLEPPPTEREQIDQIYNNLKPRYQYYIKRNESTTVPQLVVLGQEFELKLLHERSFQPPPLKSRSLVPETAYVPPSGEPSQYPSGTTLSALQAPPCWNCGHGGHRYSSCQEQRGIFCYRCGRKEVTLRTCPECRKKGNEGGAGPEGPSPAP